MQAGLLFGLDRGVMNRLGYNFQVIDVPEQALVSTMGALVVHHGAVRGWVLSA
jgi:hypothetical protein